MPAVVQKDRGSFTFTVGKLDAGMAILIGSRAHLIEFPSILLPDGVTVGSIVNINVQRNVAEEEHQKSSFWKLQNDIYMMYGIKTPVTPILKLRNVTQTSVTLEWPPLQLATASLRSLDLYRSGQRLATIPNPTGNTSTKVSGLQMASPYTFQLILRTSAGTYPSNVIEVKTHTIEDTSGISVCFGTILDSDVGDGESAAGRKEELKRALTAMGAKYSETIQIDTTHFVCTTSLSLSSISKGGGPKTAAVAEEPGVEYQKAVQLSIPIVQPDWVLACYYGKKMVPTAPYYLGSSVPPLLQGHNRVQSISRQNQPLPPSSPPSMSSASSSQAKRPAASTSNSRSNVSGAASNRASTSTPPVGNKPKGKEAFIHREGGDESMPSSASPTVPARDSTSSSKPQPVPEPSLPSVGGNDYEEDEEEPTTPSGKNRSRTGTMKKDFKFPPEGGKNSGNLRISPPPPVPPVPPIIVVHAAQDSIVEPPKPAPTPSTARVMPEPPTPDVANPPNVDMNRRDSETDGGEIVEIDLS